MQLNLFELLDRRLNKDLPLIMNKLRIIHH